MHNKLTILGSGTCNLVPEKAAASVLIEYNGARVVYDFGRGVSIRLTELGLKQDDITHIFFSHFHPDHVTDIYPYLHAASWSHIDSRHTDLHLYGPPGAQEFLQNMFAVFDWKHEFQRGFTTFFHDVAKSFTIAGQEFQMVDLHHSHGLRFGRYAVAGDADMNDKLVALLKNVELGVFDAGHISDADIVELAVRTQAYTLVCSHQYRPLDAALLNRQAKAKGFAGTLVVAQDLMSFNLGAAD